MCTRCHGRLAVRPTRESPGGDKRHCTGSHRQRGKHVRAKGIPYLEKPPRHWDHNARLHWCRARGGYSFAPKASLASTMGCNGLELVPIKSSRLAQLASSPPVGDETIPLEPLRCVGVQKGMDVGELVVFVAFLITHSPDVVDGFPSLECASL